MRLIQRNDLAARKVLDILKRLIRDERKKLPKWCVSYKHPDMAFVEVYENGREHGFAIDYCDAVKVAFSEHRSSDDIVVYVGARRDFERNTNIPSEEVFDSRKHFAYNEYEKAARFIFNLIGSHYPKA